MKRTSREITFEERTKNALVAIRAWEYAAALRLPDAELMARGKWLEKALNCFDWKHQEHIEYQTKLAQWEGLEAAAIARGLLKE